jgi:hypothetical protein
MNYISISSSLYVYKSSIPGFKKIKDIFLDSTIRIKPNLIKELPILNSSIEAPVSAIRIPFVFIFKSDNYNHFIDVGCVFKDLLIVITFWKEQNEI